MEFESYAGEGITVPEIVTAAADKHGIPQNIAHALIGDTESGYDPYAKNPKSSASGLGQIINRTGKSLGMNITGGPDDDRWHPVINADKSMEYLASLYEKTGNWNQALAQYGEGPQYARSVLRDAKLAVTVGDQIEFEPYVPGEKRSKFDYTPEEEAAAEAEIDRYVAGRKPKPELDATSQTLAQFVEPSLPSKFGEGENLYDYEAAKAAGITPDETGHWPSRVGGGPQEGLLLKHETHPTFWKTIESEKEVGNQIYRSPEGRLYSFPVDRETPQGFTPYVAPEAPAPVGIEARQGFTPYTAPETPAPSGVMGALRSAYPTPTAEGVMAGMPEAGYAERTGEMVEKAAFLPFVPLEWGVHQVGRALRPLMVQAFPKASPEEIDMALGGMELTTTLGFMPTYARMLFKGAGLLAKVGKSAFYKHAPDIFFKYTAKGGLPAVLSPEEIFSKLEGMTGAERAAMARKYPQFKEALEEMTTMVSQKRTPYSPEMAEKLGVAREGLPYPPGLAETFEMREPIPEVRRRPRMEPDVWVKGKGVYEMTPETAARKGVPFPPDYQVAPTGEVIPKGVVPGVPALREPPEAAVGEGVMPSVGPTRLYDGHAQDIVRKELITKKGGKEVGQEAAKLFGKNPSIVEIAKERLEEYNQPDLKTDKDFDGVRTRLKAFIASSEKMVVKPKAPAPAKEPWEMTTKEFMRQEYPIYPALKDQGKIVVGEQGEAHWQIQRRLKPGWENRAIDNGWVDKDGNWLTQREAAKIVQEIEKTSKSDLSVWQGHSKYIDASAKERHEIIVKQALASGKPVPPEVLADYPDLAAREPEAGVTPPPTPEAKAPPAEGKVPKGTKISRGQYYFKDAATAKQWAEANEWPTDRIMEFGKGYSIQSGPSGRYAGPGVIPKVWGEPALAKEPGKKMYGGGPETTGAIKAVIDDTAGIIRGAPPKIKAAHAYIKESGSKIWEWYTSPFETKERGFKKLLGKYLGARQIAGFENRKFLNKIQTAIPNKVTREGLTNWIQAGGDETLLRKWANKSEGTLKAGYEAALRLTPEEKAIAAQISTIFDEHLKKAQDAGILENGLENYVTQLWERGTRNKTELRKFKSEINAGLLNTNFNYARQRIFETYFTGEQAGYTPKNKDIAFLLGNYHQSLYEAIAARRAIKAMLDGKADDGLPLVSVSGMGKQIMAPEETMSFDKVSPEYDMTEAKGPEVYLIRPKAIYTESADGRRYMPIDHPALRKWKWVSNDPEGKPILLQGNMYVHPDIYNHLKNVLSRSAIRESVIGRGALTVSQNLKGVLLSAVPTPFHQVHLGSHAIFHKINPFTCPEIDFKDPIQRKAVEHGLMVYSHNALSEFAEGLQPTGIAQRIPGMGRVTQAYAEYLFQDLIPRFKMKLFKEAYERNIERYGKKYTDDQIAEISANQANAAFGELNYKAMGRNPTMQDAFRLLALAPDFLEARLRFAGQALKPGGKEQATALLRAIIGMYTAGVIGNMLFSDDRKPHWDEPFTVIIGKTRYALRSVPGDIIHLIKDPRSFVYHRLNPATMKPLVEWISKRDVFGRKRDMWDQIGDYFRGVVPIPLQGLVSKGERTLLQGVFQSLGLSSYKYRTATEKIMLDYQTAHRIDWSPEEARKREPFYKEKRDLLKKTEGDKEAFESGLRKLRTRFDLTLRRTKNIRAQFNDELKYRFNSVKDIDVAIEAYEAGTPQEKEILRRPLQKKIYNLLLRDPAKFKANNYKDKLKELRK